MSHGRQLSWDWHNPRSDHYKGVPNPNNPVPEGWYRPDGQADLDDTVFEEFLRQQGSRRTSPTPAGPRQPANLLVNPPRRSGWQQQPVHWTMFTEMRLL